MNRVIIIIMILVVASMMAIADRSSKPIPESTKRITIAATGDILAHLAIIRCAAKHSRGSSNNSGFDYLFERVAPYIKAADIACCNAEFPVAKRLRRARKQYVFNAPKGIVGAIRDAGFDVANLANNHIYNQGVDAVGETVDAFYEAGLVTVGAGKVPKDAARYLIIEKDGWRVAFLGASTLGVKTDCEPGRPCAQYFRIDEMVERIKAARAEADLVVVNVHWGIEYQTRPRMVEKGYARRMMEAGADFIAGHHPHVLQPVYRYKARDGRWRLAAMSLGNFISNQAPTYRYGRSKTRNGDPRDGALVCVTFEKKPGGGVTLVGWDAIPLWTWNARVDTRACSAGNHDIQTWNIPEAIERFHREASSGKMPIECLNYRKVMMRDLEYREGRTLDRLGVPDKSRTIRASMRAED